jgi:hypothetical protein
MAVRRLPMAAASPRHVDAEEGLWEGLVYGAAEGLLLSALPVVKLASRSSARRSDHDGSASRIGIAEELEQDDGQVRASPRTAHSPMCRASRTDARSVNDEPRLDEPRVASTDAHSGKERALVATTSVCTLPLLGRPQPVHLRATATLSVLVHATNEGSELKPPIRSASVW